MLILAAMPIGGWIAIIVVALLGGFAGGFFTARYVIKKQMKENPPINEKQIRAMFRSMGRTPSEAQVRQVMRSMREQADK